MGYADKLRAWIFYQLKPELQPSARLLTGQALKRVRTEALITILEDFARKA